jgi:N-acetylglucosaminyldiphosphoundecaprenol N-acetyl-beta-D-mannosaminyltransferase
MTIDVLGVPIAHATYEEATERVLGWARERQSRYVCLVNTHMLVEAHDDASFHDIVASADLNLPDGMPVAWMQHVLGAAATRRVRGPTLMLHTLAAAAREGLPVGLLGGTEAVLATLVSELPRRFPGLSIAYAMSPPFRPATREEDDATVAAIAASGAALLYVGLGCPKQERWMAAHRGRVPAVMLGVGAAFDMHAGKVAQAPAWMQRAGLEWVHRIVQDPRRLARRYARANPRFVRLALSQLITEARRARTARSRDT